MPLYPPKLNPGDTIGVIAPASPMRAERLTHGIQYLESRGFRIKLGQHIREVHGYLAGEDLLRSADLNAMFADDTVRAIFCARGGYGSPRILDAIDYKSIRRHPKILVGYSDITAIQLALFKKAELVTFSGPMVAVEMGNGIDPFTESNFWKMLMAPAPGFRMITNSDSICLRPGRATGRLLGGCLSLICSLLGTPFLPDFKGAILFVEEVGEEPYRIDRMLNQLKLAGILNSVNGIVFGQFPDCAPKSDSPSLTLQQVFAELTADLSIPILMNFPYGHVDAKYTIPVGAEAIINTDDGSLEIPATPVLDTIS